MIQDQLERTDMEDEKGMTERLEAATTLLERTLSWLEERQGALSGEVEKISATVEQSGGRLNWLRSCCRRTGTGRGESGGSAESAESPAQDGARDHIGDARQAWDWRWSR